MPVYTPLRRTFYKRGDKPLCIDLFCGLGGWTDGFIAEGYDCIGFDIERHDYGSGTYPGRLVVRNVLTIHGAEFRFADVIVASPPCQEFSYMAMPWKRGKQIARALRGEDHFPPKYKGSRTVGELTRLFDACFRIQREACEAAGRYIPLVVENVKGAQKWVGKAAGHFGSFYLWGDVPTLPVWFNDDKCGRKCGVYWFGSGNDCSLMRRMSSRSIARKAASAQIAKIPFDLARHVASYYYPSRESACA